MRHSGKSRIAAESFAGSAEIFADNAESFAGSAEIFADNAETFAGSAESFAGRAEGSAEERRKQDGKFKSKIL